MTTGQYLGVYFPVCGGAEVMELRAISSKPLEPHQVLVKHEAIGVNFIDTYHRSGLYPLPLPSRLGKEAAGIVEAIGSDVSQVSVGDRVAYVNGPIGAYAEKHIVDETALIHLPKEVSAETAAAMMLKGLTAAYLLLKTHRLTADETILVHAAAGGVSSILIPWAKYIGARVIGTVGSSTKIATAKANGCDEVLLYREDDIPQAVNAITAGRGVDVVYDSVGKDTFEMSLDCLRPRGLFVSFGNASGAVPDFSPLYLSKKGSLFMTRPVLFDYVCDRNEQQELADALFDQIKNQRIAVNITHRLLLSQAFEAHQLLESGTTTGSLILVP